MKPFLLTKLLLATLVVRFASAADAGRAPAIVTSISPVQQQAFQAWGTSLAWSGAVVYSSRFRSAALKTEQARAAYMDLLFGEPNERRTLGLTLVRYNIGGGENPLHSHLEASHQMEGFKDNEAAPYDFNRDLAQQRMLREAKRRGANVFEAFSNSPPYWMTESGCVAGNFRAKTNNLDPRFVGPFADYLVTAMKEIEKRNGVRFATLEPFNEPEAPYWVAGSHQEGAYFDPASQMSVVKSLRQRIDAESIKTRIATSDSNSLDEALSTWKAYDQSTRDAVAQINTHSYFGGHRTELAQLAQTLKKPLSMSELGCCLKDQGDGTEFGGAINMAQHIQADLGNLAARSWSLWQPDWNIVGLKPDRVLLKKQFFALAQFTNFIRPGFRILKPSHSDVLAAVSADHRRLVIVVVNDDDRAFLDLDLSQFELRTGLVRVFTTSEDPNVNLRPSRLRLTQNSHLKTRLPAESIVTYVIDNLQN